MNDEEHDIHGMYKIRISEGPDPELMGAETLLGNDVYNLQDADLGNIKEIMLDMRTGRVKYAVLSFGGFLGLGEKLFAVPWSALVLDTRNKRFTLNVAKKRLTSAPGFDPDNWPAMADVDWAGDIHDCDGAPPFVDTVVLWAGPSH